MGCFNFRCGLSGLPIYANEPVQWLLLTANSPRVRARWDLGEDVWLPRTIPVPGRYNEYGSLEYPRTATNRLFRRLVAEGLRVDVVERGWGPNTCHDVPVTRRDLRSFDRILKAAWEGRLLVRDLVGLHKRHRTVPRGIPTRARVERILRRNRLPAIASEHAPGRVTVRARCFGCHPYPGLPNGFGQESETLEAAARALTPAYATAMSAAGDKEPILVVTPGSPGAGGETSPVAEEPAAGLTGLLRASRPPHLPVAQTMVRRDVWQGAVRLYSTADTLATAVRTLREEIKDRAGSRANLLTESVLQHLSPEDAASVRELIAATPRTDPPDEFELTQHDHDRARPLTLNPGSSVVLLGAAVRAGQLDPDGPAATAVLQALAELRVINRHLGTYNGAGSPWQPGRIACQEPVWDQEVPWRQLLTDIARDRLRHSERD